MCVRFGMVQNTGNSQLGIETITTLSQSASKLQTYFKSKTGFDEVSNQISSKRSKGYKRKELLKIARIPGSSNMTSRDFKVPGTRPNTFQN